MLLHNCECIKNTELDTLNECYTNYISVILSKNKTINKYSRYFIKSLDHLFCMRRAK